MASVFIPTIYSGLRVFSHWLTPGAELSETLTLPTSDGAVFCPHAFVARAISTGIHMCLINALFVVSRDECHGAGLVLVALKHAL